MAFPRYDSSTECSAYATTVVLSNEVRYPTRNNNEKDDADGSILSVGYPFCVNQSMPERQYCSLAFEISHALPSVPSFPIHAMDDDDDATHSHSHMQSCRHRSFCFASWNMATGRRVPSVRVGHGRTLPSWHRPPQPNGVLGDYTKKMAFIVH